MSFYIKSFRLSPQALEKGDAIPDKTRFTIQSDVVCLQHRANCKFRFSYYAGEIEIAHSSKDSSSEIDSHIVNDEVEAESNRWGGGTVSEIPLTVVVTQEADGENKNNATSTWVEE